MARNQSAEAQKLYDGRSDVYDNSWHVRFGRHMIELASVSPGQKVLDLACGTGLATFPAAEAIGPSGLAIGVDISSGMLAQAQKKLEKQLDLKNVSFHQHSITDLDGLDILKQTKGSFDLITCASALVLLPEPADAVKEWASYLKPGGKMVTDVTHINSQLPGVTYERVGQRLDLPVSFHRTAFQKPDDLRNVMEIAGLTDVKVIPVAQLQIESTEDLKDYLAAGAKSRVAKEYTIDDADHIFEASIDGVAWEQLAEPAIRDQARRIFKEEWTKLADPDGKVRELDCVYVGIGTKP